MAAEQPVCAFGWQAVPFELPDPDGRMHRLSDLAGPRGTLVMFICNHCPYVKAIADRLAATARELRGHGVESVAINANDWTAYPEDAPDRMKAFAAAHGFDFPYLVDESQDVARAYEAVCTPDFFGFNADLALQYRGRLDASRREPVSDARPELLEAMAQVAEIGRGPADQTPSMGCTIKWRDA